MGKFTVKLRHTASQILKIYILIRFSALTDYLITCLRKNFSITLASKYYKIKKKLRSPQYKKIF